LKGQQLLVKIDPFIRAPAVYGLHHAKEMQVRNGGRNGRAYLQGAEVDVVDRKVL
jgi:hypothetical protein